MLSIILMALMLGVLGAALQTVMNGWDRYSNRMSEQDMLLRAANLIRRDVAVMQRIAWPSPVGSSNISQSEPEKKLRFIFHGTSNRLQFVAIEPPFPTLPGPFVLNYSIAGGKIGRLTRSRTRYHPKMHSLAEIKFENHVPLIEGAYRLGFKYGHKVSDPTGVAGRRQWLRSWPYSDRLPDLIRFEIRNTESGKLATPPLIARPKLDAEQGCAARRKAVTCTIELADRDTRVQTKAANK